MYVITPHPAVRGVGADPRAEPFCTWLMDLSRGSWVRLPPKLVFHPPIWYFEMVGDFVSLFPGY